MVEITPRSKHLKTGKSVLLYSGGLDSVLFDWLLNPDILLHIPSGSKYASIEHEHLMRLGENGGVNLAKVTTLSDVLNLQQFERPDSVVPNRNAFYLLFASIYGETLYLGAVAGDGNLDKDETFFAKMKALLDHTWQGTDWNERREFLVRSPFKERTKASLVKDYLDARHDPQHLLTSYSCHNGAEPPCGVCGPCSRKWVALSVNGIDIPDGYFAGPFWENDEWLAGKDKFLKIPGEGGDFGKFLEGVK